MFVQGNIIVLIFVNVIAIPLIFFITNFFSNDIAVALAIVAIFISISTSICTVSMIPKKELRLSVTNRVSQKSPCDTLKA